jgi:hypothetical protein
MSDLFIYCSRNTVRALLKSVLCLVILGLPILFLSSCAKEGSTDAASGDGGDDGDDGNGGGGNNPPIGSIDNNDFWVRLYDSGKFPFHAHKSTGFSDECKIPFATSLSAIDCNVEVNELDLYFNKIQFHYNVPTGMCDYLRITPYYFYNQEIGYGPSDVVINVTYDSTNAVVTSDCVVDGTAGPCTLNNAVPNYRELNFDLTTAGATCVYDRSASGGNNCCFGNYIMTQNVTRIPSTGPPNITTSVRTDSKWGGNRIGCYGGHVRTSGWTLISYLGFPLSSLQYVGGAQGLNNTTNLPPLIDEPKGSDTMTVANYYSTSGLHNHVDIGTGLISSSLPYFIDPIDDRSGTLLSATSDAWTFDCLDKAYEVKNRIKLYIREWDVYSDYLTYISSAGVTVNPDRSGVEGGGNCSGIGDLCNDFWDLDDVPNYFNGNSGSYDQSALNKITKRRYFFPDLAF